MATTERIRRSMKPRSFALAAMFTFALAMSQTVQATRYEWNGSGNLYWTTDGNWSSMSGSGNKRFLRSKAAEGKRTVKFNAATSIDYDLSVESAGTSDSAPYIFLADNDSYGLTSSGVLDVGTYKVGHLAIQRGTYQCATLNTGNGAGTSGNVLVIGGAGYNASLTSTGNTSINKDTLKVSAKGTFASNGDMYVGNNGGAGVLTLDGGSVTVASGKWLRLGYSGGSTGTGTVNLNGGVLTCKHIHNDRNGTVVFNGGTLKANSAYTGNGGFMQDGLSAKVTAKGGTIDTGSYDVTISAALSDNDASAPGGMKFCGGGTLTLGGSIGYTGGTTIEAGTTIKVASLEQKDALLGRGVNTLKVIPASGTHTLITITGDGEFSETDLLKVALAPGSAGTATFSLSNDRKSLLADIPYSGEAINQTTPTLVFPGATLADLATHTLRARMQGDNFDADGVEATFFNRQETMDGDVLAKVTYQLQAVDESSNSHYTKAAKVEFTADANGVYAKLVEGNYTNYGNPAQFGNDPLTTNPGTSSYIPYDFRLVEPANAISVNIDPAGRSGAANTLDTTSSVRYGGGDYAVPYSAWSNFSLPSSQANATATIGGATITISNQQGNYYCSNASATKDMRHGYIDDGSSKPNPQITVTDIPYEFYRIVVYMSSDTANCRFGYLTINGKNYTASGDARSSDTVATVEGAATWGYANAGTGNYLYGLKEGVNYLVSDVNVGSAATIVGHRSSTTVRTGIAAFQIVEYVPTTYTATISDGGAKTFSALSWDKTLPALLTANDRIVVNVNEDTTLNVDIAVDVYGITFNVVDGKTLTLSGNNIAAQYITATGAGQTVVANASQLSGTVKGDGTLIYGAAPSGLTLADGLWSGVLWLKNGTMNGLLAQNLARAESTLRLTGVTGYFNNADSEMTCLGTLELVDDGATPAFTVNNGFSTNGKTVFAALTGDGTFKSDTTTSQRYVFKDVSAFTGTIDIPSGKLTRVILGDGTSLNPAAGTITVASGATATVAAGKTWTAQGGMTVDGTLMLGAGATVSAVLSGTGAVGVTSGTGTLNGYGANAALELATAPGATLAIVDAGLATMTVGAFSNLGTVDLRSTALTEATLNLGSGVTAAATGTILYPATFQKFVVSPVDQSIRSLTGYTLVTGLPQGAAYYVTLAETREEFGKGLMTVTNCAVGVNVRVARPNGTSIDVVPVDGAAMLTETPQIAGEATLFDITFKNNSADIGKKVGAFTYKDFQSAVLRYDTEATFNNSDWDDSTGVYIKHHPYIGDAYSAFVSLSNFAAVVVGKMSPTHKTQFIHLGSSSASDRKGILITTTENNNEVLIAMNTGSVVDTAGGVRVSVPNAATARHAYVIVRTGDTFAVWVDGVKRGSFTVPAGFTLGNSGSAGLQVGSDFGGAIARDSANGNYANVAVNDSETGVINVIRVFDYPISDAQAEAIFNAYPYVSQGGLYTRTVAADGTFSETGAWEKDGASGTFAVPEGATVDGVTYNPSATLTVSAAAEIGVNADVAIETLTVGGSAPVRFTADGTHTLTVVGSAIINSPVTNEYGAVYLAGAPVQLGSSGSICFDCSGMDVSKVYAVTRFQLTGLTDQNDGKVTAIFPTDPDRSYEIVYNTTGSCYDLVITPLHNYVVADNMVTTSPTMTTDNIIVGAGGLNIETLSLPDNATVLYDPIKTPFYVWGTTEGAFSIGTGVKFKLTPNYANMTLGRVILFAYKAEYVTGLPEDLNTLLDATSIAPGATFTITSEDVPDDSPYRKQIVLTVGDYANNAKEIRLTCIGDSITQGTTPTIAGTAYNSGIAAQYRTSIAARLAANGYKPKMLGIWKCNRDDGARVQQDPDWIWHSGISGDRIKTGGTRGGVRDNLHVYLDVAGKVDALTLLIGTNDIGAGDTAEDTYAAYTNLVFDIARQRPATKIIGSTILDRNGAESENHAKVVAFNALLAADYSANRLPANYVMLDLFAEVPLTSGAHGNFSDDLLHPSWIGHSAIAECFAAGITNALPFASYAGPIEDEATDAPQSALGVAGIAATADGTGLAAYTNGMVHVFTIDAASSNNQLYGTSPYTATNTTTALNRPVTKAGYFMELVRKGTSRHRWVWVDFDATGKTLDEIDFPWTGANVDHVVDDLHVFSNDGSIHNIAANAFGVKGAIEGTHFNYSVGDDNENVPADLNGYGWNDTLGSSSGYGGFQAHRIFNEGEHWNGGEVLFAWNAWGSSNTAVNDELGIGTFFYSQALGGDGNSADYTFTKGASNGAADTITAAGYQVVHFEIWATFDGEPRHGVWCGAGMDGDFDTAANWEDGRVPAAGENIDFSAIPAATTISVTGVSTNKIFGTATMGSSVVTFTGSVAFNAITDTSKVAVGADSTVTLDGNLEFSGSGYQYVVNTVAAGGTFVVTGDVIAKADFTGYLFHSKIGGSGAVQARGLVNNATGNSDQWAFRINSEAEGEKAYWTIGDHGLSGSRYFWTNGSHPVEIRPLDSGFTFSTKVGINSDVTLDTTGADGNPYTIMMNGDVERSGTLNVIGTGTVVDNFSLISSYAMSGAVNVGNQATLAVNPGKTMTTGTISVSSNATLQVAQSGAFALGGGLTLADGAILGFNYTDRNSAPVLDATGKTVTFGEQTNVVVKVTGSVRPKKGAYVLTSGGKFTGANVSLAADSETWAKSVSVNEDGNLELQLKNVFMILVR